MMGSMKKKKLVGPWSGEPEEIALGELILGRSISSIIWSKDEQDFIPLSNVPSFSGAIGPNHGENQREERFNFQKEVVKLLYFQDTRMVDFIENGTKVTGILGDVWNIIADYLNFTLVPKKIEFDGYGVRHPNGSFDGLVGYLQRNETQIIPRIVLLAEYGSILDYVCPFWKIHYGVYIKPKMKYDEYWFSDVFSTELWITSVIVLFILSISGYVTGKTRETITKEKINFSLNDHILYTVALAAQQGSVPAEFPLVSRRIYAITTFFSWIIVVSLNAQAIYYLVDKELYRPFVDLISLIRSTNYDLLIDKGGELSKIYRTHGDRERVSITTIEKLFKKVCSTQIDNVAGFLANDRYKATSKIHCDLIEITRPYFPSLLASAIQKGLHVRSFNIGILRLHENGILNKLKQKYFSTIIQKSDETIFESVNMSQVGAFLQMLVASYAVSFCIFIIEHIVYNVQKFRKGRKRWALARRPIHSY
ncbi:hypothetical protein QAD02_019799 [Eretmocerus hayati]|uniref:Uncharacterized protein n=1 Tax=Eretmocerus hayati TaxID=131215 RepID=A0ACC2PKW6_9HYME|nr:hypothetical protein QAD02_019799 [Eretmocerus hayati]